MVTVAGLYPALRVGQMADDALTGRREEQQ